MFRFRRDLLPAVVLACLATGGYAQTPDIQGSMLHPTPLPSEIAQAVRIRVGRPDGFRVEPERIVFRDLAGLKLQPGDGWGGRFEVALCCDITDRQLIRAWADTGRSAIWFEGKTNARIC